MKAHFQEEGNHQQHNTTLMERRLKKKKKTELILIYLESNKTKMTHDLRLTYLMVSNT